MHSRKSTLGNGKSLRHLPATRNCAAPVAGTWGIVLALSAAALAGVEVNVSRVGFPILPAGDATRPGAWTPVIVDVSLLNEASFDGTLRIAQTDNDGDECYDSVDVHLRKDTGGNLRVCLYALAGAQRGESSFSVELRNARGEIVKMVCQGELTYHAQPAQQPTVLADDDLLIISVSTSAVGRIKDLVSTPDTEKQEAFSREVHVGHLSPDELPEQWIGLETVDYIVWEDAHADDLNERQMQAVLEWVRQGGTLFIAASRTAGALLLVEPLNAVLPAHIGEVVSVENLPDVRLKLVGEPLQQAKRRNDPLPWYDVPFAAPVPVARAAARPGATLIADEDSIFSDVITRRRVGRGHVIFSGVTLHDLFTAPGGAVGFFKKVFHLSPLEATDQGRPQPVSLFEKVVGPVSFSTSGSLYLLVASFASISYVILATFGSWSVLSARGWRHHSWSAFAAVAVAAGILTVLAINFMRGFGDSLRQITIVDADAGSSSGQATAFFGLKTGTDKRVEVWLPSDPLGATEPTATTNFLRPVPGSSDPLHLSANFADPEEYRLVPGSAVVDGVRVRGTLKQFEGRWKGPLGGTFTGQVRVQKRVISDDSFVMNNLGVDLTECLLVQPALNLAEYSGARSHAIYVFNVGDLPVGGGRVSLAARCYRLGPDESMGQFIVRSTLENAQREWQKVAAGLGASLAVRGRAATEIVGYAHGQEKQAVLLLSTIGDLNPHAMDSVIEQWMGRHAVSRDRLRSLDLREQLEPGTPTRDNAPPQPGNAILIGFAAQPGPVRLFLREDDSSPYRLMIPEAGRSSTVYRIRLPLTDLGGDFDVPAKADAEPGEP